MSCGGRWHLVLLPLLLLLRLLLRLLLLLLVLRPICFL
jgi:hypothetical protein